MQYLIVSVLLLFCSNSFGQYLSGNGSSGQENSNSRNVNSADTTLGSLQPINCPFGSEFANGYCVRAKPFDPLGRLERFCPEGTQEGINPRTFYPECMNTRKGNVQAFDHGSEPTNSHQSPCQQDIRATERSCKGAELSQLGSVADVLARQVASAKAAGNMKQACAAAKQVNNFSFSSNAAMAQMCANAIKRCRSTCISEGNGDAVTECESFEKYSQLAVAQSVQSAQNFAKSSECMNVVSGTCAGQSAFDNENCPEFCQKPGRQNHAKCRVASNNCADSNFAAQNIKLCTCVANPYASICNNAGPNDLVSNPPQNTVVDSPHFPSSPRDYDTQMQNRDLIPSEVRDNNAHVDGGVTDGEKSFALGTHEKPKPDYSYDTDILLGTNKAPPALGTPESIYGPDYENNPQYLEQMAKEDQGFNLKDFLPDFLKNKPKNNRVPASAGYADPTITKSNGLSNWQKVSRRIRILRPELAP